MAYEFGAAASGLTGRIRVGGGGQGRARLALVLRLENPESLCASLGPAQFEQMMDRLTLRLASDLRLIPQTRTPGAAEIRGLLVDPGRVRLSRLAQRLQQVCQAGIDLAEIRVAPQVHAAIVSEGGARHELSALYACGASALGNRDLQAGAGRVLFVEMPGAARGEVPFDLPALAEHVRLNFQPQLCCDTGQVAALRIVPFIDHPRHGRLELAELQPQPDGRTSSGITCAALRKAMAALHGWDRLGRRIPFISVQISDRELAEPDMADAIIWELDRLDLAPGRLELEICEPIGQGDHRIPVAESLQRLAGHGCRIALGNFGSGSAGLAELRRFGVGRVRIGREFIAGCDRREDQQNMILAVVALAEHLRLSTLADGVDTTGEHAFVGQIGFSSVQGLAVAPLLDAGGTDAFLLEIDQSLPAPFETRRRI